MSTSTALKPGDQVVMSDVKYHVPNRYRNKVWTVRSEPWVCCGTEVVLLEGFAGGYAVDGLLKVPPKMPKQALT